MEPTYTLNFKFQTISDNDEEVVELFEYLEKELSLKYMK